MRFSFGAVVLSSLLSLVTLPVAAVTQGIKIFDLPAQPLVDSLRAIASQSNSNVFFDPAVVAGKQGRAVKVSGTVEGVLRELLEGTGLTYRFSDERTVRIVEVGQVQAAQDQHALWLAQVDRSFSRQGGDGSQGSPSSSQKEGGDENGTEGEKQSAESSDQEPSPEKVPEEVVITGTQIEGGQIASPVLVFTQADIEKSGAATAQQFLAKLPQNFGGGRTEDTNNAIPGGGVDRAYGSAINLRGLGSGSTLVLVNGRRSAVSGAQEYVDISMIPLSAVERIEVLTDGSSAIYGSDAIGGVVNFIMRKRYSGAETRLRLGGTTQGGGREYQVAQSFGAGWDAGNVLVNFERYQKDKITSLEREFSSGALFPRNLAAGSTKDSIHVHAGQELPGSVRLFGDLSFSERHIDDWSPVDADPANFFSESFAGDVRQYGGSAGVTIDMGSSWQTELVAGADHVELDGRLFNNVLLGLGFGEGVFVSNSNIRYFDAKITGDLFPMPAGNVQFALGVGERKSKYESRNGLVNRGISETDGSSTDHEARHLFTEFLIPVIGGTDRRQSNPRLAFSLAGRYEEDSYSTGAKWSSVDPKFGVLWMPMDSVQLRATYGTSFKAPNVVQTDDRRGSWAVFDFPDPQSATGLTRTLVYIGNNRLLKPETATTWTVGTDIKPPQFTGFRAALTYFYIDYTDRIDAAPSSTPALVLYDPSFMGVRTRRVDIGDPAFNSIASEILARGVGDCRDANGASVPVNQPCPMAPDNFAAMMDLGLRNLAVSQDRGIDLSLTQHVDLGDASIEFALNGTYLFDFLRQFTAYAPTLELVSSTYNPTDVRIQASSSWSLRGWTITGEVHYNDNYRDFSVPGSPDSIASWATVDLNLGFDTGRSSWGSWFNDILITLNADNIFDKNPPRFGNHRARLGFDPANGDPYGRIVSLTLRKSW